MGVGVLVALLGSWQGEPWADVVELGIALAVAAVPEALPAVATIALAVGIHRMSRRKAIVRRLPAVEALGSTTVVCTDKTRTLTSGNMSVVTLWASGAELALEASHALQVEEPLRKLVEAAVLASRAQAAGAEGVQAGDPVDAAILACGTRLGILLPDLLAAQPRIALVPFSSERKLMASFHQSPDGVTAHVKGAPREVLERCHQHVDGRTLTDGDRAAIAETNGRLARQGLRVLAAASGPVAAPDEAALRGLRFAGLVGLMDPPAPGVKETVARLRDAGMRTVMITGDQHQTAETVGRDLGLITTGSQVVTGRDLDRMSPGELQARAAEVGVYSRVSPAHKLAIVAALQARGEIVAMLGDGVNDAAALRKADVGVAMGRRGTDVAKEAASIVLQDDRFDTIAAAVEEGRVIFDNIQKVVLYLFSCNVAEVLVLVVAGVAGWPMPLRPLQLLWLNMLTDTLPALSLTMEPGDGDLMRRPPRDPQEAILSRRFIERVLAYGGLITLSTLLAFGVGLRQDVRHAQTMAFMTLAFAQIWHLGNARSSSPVLRPHQVLANHWALAAVGLSIVLQLASLYVPPLARVLGLVLLDSREWLVVLAASSAPAVVGQLVKAWRLGLWQAATRTARGD